jgi:hypothetical protein
MRRAHLSEEGPENDNRPSTSDALTVSIEDCLRDHGQLQSRPAGVFFDAFGDLDESTQPCLVMSNIESLDDLMAVMLQGFLSYVKRHGRFGVYDSTAIRWRILCPVPLSQHCRVNQFLEI